MKKTALHIAALSAAVAFSVKQGAAQDTVKVIHDTVRVIERNEVHNVPDDREGERPPLRVGEFGIRYMPTFSWLDLRTYSGTVVEGSAQMSNGFGAMFAINLGRHIGLQAEVNYYEATQSYKDRSLDRQVNINYLNIPLLLSINTDKTLPVNLNLVAGPQFGINIGSKLKTTGSENTDTLRAVVALKQGDVGLAYGGGLEFALNRIHTFRLDLGFRGFYGLVDMNSTSSGNTYNIIVKASRKTYGGYIGFTFLF